MRSLILLAAAGVALYSCRYCDIGAVECEAGAAERGFPDLFDIDIGGKYWARQQMACGNSCGVCGAAHNGCDYEGQTLGCKYTFCTYGTMPDGTPFSALRIIKKKYGNALEICLKEIRRLKAAGAKSLHFYTQFGCQGTAAQLQCEGQKKQLEKRGYKFIWGTVDVGDGGDCDTWVDISWENKK